MKNLATAALAALSILAGASAFAAPAITNEIVPQYMASGTTTRLPIAVWVEIGGLTPNATYRYIQQFVDTAVDTATTSGAGNPIFVAPAGSPVFTYNSSTNLANAGQYGEFTADASGNYTGWFGGMNTGNARFDGTKDLSLRIRINDGANGTTVVDYLTTTAKIRPLVFGATATNGTGIYSSAASSLTAKNVVLLYDNTAAAGRPLATAFVEDMAESTPAVGGSAALSSIPAFYSTSVDAQAKTFGAIIPNTLPNGVRAIVERNIATGAVVNSFTDADGVFPSTASTVNPAGGTTAIALNGATDLVTVTAVSDWSIY